MKVRLYVNTGYPGASHEDVIEVDDDATDDDLEELAREYTFNQIDFGFVRLVDAWIGSVSAPTCHECGSIMVRDGVGQKCTNCGSTSAAKVKP